MKQLASNPFVRRRLRLTRDGGLAGRTLGPFVLGFALAIALGGWMGTHAARYYLDEIALYTTLPSFVLLGLLLQIRFALYLQSTLPSELALPPMAAGEIMEGVYTSEVIPPWMFFAGFLAPIPFLPAVSETPPPLHTGLYVGMSLVLLEAVARVQFAAALVLRHPAALMLGGILPGFCGFLMASGAAGLVARLPEHVAVGLVAWFLVAAAAGGFHVMTWRASFVLLGMAYDRRLMEELEGGTRPVDRQATVVYTPGREGRGR